MATPQKPPQPPPTSRTSIIKKSSSSSTAKKQSSYSNSKSPKMSPFEVRFYIIVAAVLLLCIAVLSFFILDQVALGGKWKKKWFAAKPPTHVSSPLSPNNGQDTTAVSAVPVTPADLGTIGDAAMLAAIPVGDEGDIKNSPEDNGDTANEEMTEEERQQQEELARQQQLIAEENERLRLEKERRDIQIAESLTAAVENFPKIIPLAVPQMSPFGTLESSQFVPYTIKELGPFTPVAANVTLTWSPVLVDSNVRFSLKKDTEKDTEINTENDTGKDTGEDIEKDTAVSPTWRLCTDDQNGEKVLATVRFHNEESTGLVFVWESAARDTLNYSLLCKLPFACLKCEVSHCDRLYQVSAGLFSAESVGTVELRSFVSQQGQATAKIPTLFGLPNREKAFAKMDTTPQLEWQPVLLPESVPGVAITVEDQGKIKRILFTVDVPDKGTVIFPVEGELFSQFVQFTDISWVENNAIRTQRAELSRKQAAGELDEAEKLRQEEELNTLSSLRTNARLLLRNANIRLSFQLDAVAPNTTDRIRIMQYDK